MPGFELHMSLSFANSGQESRSFLARGSKMLQFSPNTTAWIMPSFLRLLRDALMPFRNAPPMPLEPYPWMIFTATAFRAFNRSSSDLRVRRASSTVGYPISRLTVASRFDIVCNSPLTLPFCFPNVTGRGRHSAWFLVRVAVVDLGVERQELRERPWKHCKGVSWRLVAGLAASWARGHCMSVRTYQAATVALAVSG